MLWPTMVVAVVFLLMGCGEVLNEYYISNHTTTSLMQMALHSGQSFVETQAAPNLEALITSRD